MTSPSYRSDIDGLRGIAILLVLAFHIFPSQFAGGYLGVDIFFVISGYLITTLIQKKLHKNEFSFFAFFGSRVLRLFPALIVLLSCSLIVGFFYLLPDEFGQLGGSLSAAAAFVANHAFQSESGYFDQTSVTKPLLHLWSLSIEEQFYLIWPMLLWGCLKKKVSPRAVAILLTVISGCFYFMTVKESPIQSFFSTHSRAWEILLGACLALYPDKLKKLPSALGLFLLALGIAVSSILPSTEAWVMLVIPLGTVLLLASGPDSLFNKVLLSNKILVAIGLISYPLYLWHWPLLSFFHVLQIEPPDLGQRMLVVALSFILATLTYVLIEKPIRKKKTNAQVIISLIMGNVLLLFLGLWVYQQQGFPARYPQQQIFAEFYHDQFPQWKYYYREKISKFYRNECSFFDMEKSLKGQPTNVPLSELDVTCFKRDLTYSKSIFVWGDSHAQHLNYGLTKTLPTNWQILQVAGPNCQLELVVSDSSVSHCQKSNWFALKSIRETQPDVVILAQAQGHSVQNILQIVGLLNEWKIKKIIVTGPAPHWNMPLSKMIRKHFWEETPRYLKVGYQKHVFDQNAQIKQSQKNFLFADILNLMCRKEGCLTYLSDDKLQGLTTWDHSHFTPKTSEYVARELLLPMILQ